MISNVQTALHSWDKSLLVMTHYLFYTLLDLDTSLFTIFAYKFMRDIGLCFLSLFSPNVFDFVRVPLKVFFPPLFNGNVQYNLRTKMSEFFFFFIEIFLIANLIPLIDTGLFRLFLLERLQQFVSLKEIVLFTLSCLIYWYRGVHNIPLLISSYLQNLF